VVSTHFTKAKEKETEKQKAFPQQPTDANATSADAPDILHEIVTTEKVDLKEAKETEKQKALQKVEKRKAVLLAKEKESRKAKARARANPSTR